MMKMARSNDTICWHNGLQLVQKESPRRGLACNADLHCKEVPRVEG